MAAWRMAFRVGEGGISMWPECRRLGGAAIGYGQMPDTDLSLHSPDEPNPPWKVLASGPQTSIRRFAYIMQPGDTIYVKEGPMIVGRGTVTGPYVFNPTGFVREDSDFPWQHQRAVTWHNEFPEVKHQLGRAPMFTVEQIDDDSIEALNAKLLELGWSDPVDFASPDEVPLATALTEGAATWKLVNAYERSSAARTQCLAAHGTTCGVCDFNFGVVYGPVAEGYIHVHHLRLLSEIGQAHPVDPVADLRPVCPNCHAVLHMHTPPYSIEDVRVFLGR